MSERKREKEQKRVTETEQDQRVYRSSEPEYQSSIFIREINVITVIRVIIMIKDIIHIGVTKNLEC